MPAKVWTSDGLWKGFLRCARMMAKESGATSFIAMVQLPDKTLKEALAHPLMKVKCFLIYIVGEPWYLCYARFVTMHHLSRSRRVFVPHARWKLSLCNEEQVLVGPRICRRGLRVVFNLCLLFQMQPKKVRPAQALRNLRMYIRLNSLLRLSLAPSSSALLSLVCMCGRCFLCRGSKNRCDGMRRLW